MPDFGASEVALPILAEGGMATGAVGAAGAGAATAGGGGFLASALPWLQGASALTSILGIVGGTKANVQAAGGQANIAEMEAASTRAAAQFNAAQVDRANKLAIAKGVATAAASGADVSSGSPLLNELENVKQAAIQKQTILNAGETGGQALDYRARLARAGIPGAITSGIAQGASVLSSWVGNRQLSNLRMGGYY